MLELLLEMLQHDPDARPSAEQVTAWCEALIDELDPQATLRAWARKRSWPEAGPGIGGDLDGAVLTEGTMTVPAPSPGYIPEFTSPTVSTSRVSRAAMVGGISALGLGLMALGAAAVVAGAAVQLPWPTGGASGEVESLGEGERDAVVPDAAPSSPEEGVAEAPVHSAPEGSPSATAEAPTSPAPASPAEVGGKAEERPVNEQEAATVRVVKERESRGSSGQSSEAKAIVAQAGRVNASTDVPIVLKLGQQRRSLAPGAEDVVVPAGSWQLSVDWGFGPEPVALVVEVKPRKRVTVSCNRKMRRCTTKPAR